MGSSIAQVLRKTRAASHDKVPFDDLLAAKPRKIQDLIRICEDPGQPDPVRIAVCRVLGEMRLRRALPSMLKLLEEDTKPSVVWAATLAVEHIASKTAVPFLMEIALSSAHRLSRESAIHALGSLGDARAGIVLRAILQNRKTAESTRVEAAEALQLLLYSGIRLRGAVPALIRTLDDLSPLVRWSIVAALAHSADPRAVTALKKLLGDRGTPDGLDSVGEQAESALRVLTSRQDS